MTHYKRPPNSAHMSSVGVGGKEIKLNADGVADLTGVDSRYFATLRAQGWEPVAAPPVDPAEAAEQKREQSALETLAIVDTLSNDMLRDELAAGGVAVGADTARDVLVSAVLELRLEAQRKAGQPGDAPAPAPGSDAPTADGTIAQGGLKPAAETSTPAARVKRQPKSTFEQ